MPNEPKPFVLPERNPLTHARHRKEVFWQITLPVILCALLLVAAITALVVMTVNEAQLEDALATGWYESERVGDFSPDEKAMLTYMRGTTHRLSNVSQMWLLAPVLCLALLPMALLVGLVVLSTKLLGVLPGSLRLVQDFMVRLGLRIKTASDAAVRPILKVNSLSAAARRARQSTRQTLSELFAQFTRQ